MRTQDEILTMVRKRMNACSFFDFAVDDLLSALDYERAKEFLKPEVKAEEWQPRATTPDAWRAVLRDYMEFAFDKAHSERGLSAMRSLQHLWAWSWLAGDDALASHLEKPEYHDYGLEYLRAVCHFYGWEPKEFGDA